jgi:hypothetical protein
MTQRRCGIRWAVDCGLAMLPQREHFHDTTGNVQRAALPGQGDRVKKQVTTV